MRRFTLAALLLLLLCGTTLAQNWATMGDSAVDPGNSITFRFSPTQFGIQIDVYFQDKAGNNVIAPMLMDLPIELDGQYVTGLSDGAIPFGLTYSGGSRLDFSVYTAGFAGMTEDMVDSIDSPISIADFLGDITYMSFSGKGMGVNDGEWAGDQWEAAATMFGGPILWSINVGGQFTSTPEFFNPLLDIDGGTWIGMENPLVGGALPWLNFGDLSEDDQEWLGESLYGKTLYTQDLATIWLSQGELFNIFGALTMPIGWEYVEITVGGRDIPFVGNEVPEPATLLLLGVAAAGIPMIRRRKK